MKRLALILGLSLAILATGVPVSAQGMRMRFGGGGFHGFMGGRFAGGRFAGGNGFGRPIAPPFARRPFFGKRFDRFAFVLPVPVGFYGAWSPFYGYPYGYPPPYGGYPPPYANYPVAYDLPAASQTAHDPPPLLYTPTAVRAIPPVPSPPMPEVVEFSTGRYHLRDDGSGTAYSWVWIPNPPTAPPADAQSPAPAQPPHTRLYRWTDDQGVVHLTNLWDEVPPQYRQQVKPPQTS
jgi:hypothetical protein